MLEVSEPAPAREDLLVRDRVRDTARTQRRTRDPGGNWSRMGTANSCLWEIFPTIVLKMISTLSSQSLARLLKSGSIRSKVVVRQTHAQAETANRPLFPTLVLWCSLRQKVLTELWLPNPSC